MLRNTLSSQFGQKIEWGWQYTVTHGVSGIEATQNWAICFFGNPTGNFTFKVAVLKIK